MYFIPKLVKFGGLFFFFFCCFCVSWGWVGVVLLVSCKGLRLVIMAPLDFSVHLFIELYGGLPSYLSFDSYFLLVAA